MAARGALAILASVLSSQALAEPAGSPATSSIWEVERHYTTNALDAPRAIADWYTQLRGTLGHVVAIEDGQIRYEARLEVTRFDSVGLEDDRSATVSAEMSRKLSPSVEVKGVLSLSAVDIGDDLTIGETTLGTRVQKAIGAGGVQLAVDLGDGATLLAALAGNTERPNGTRIDGLDGRYELEPERAQADASLKLSKAAGIFSYGASVAGRLIDAEHIGVPPSSLGGTVLTALAEGAARTKAGWVLQLAAGVQALRAEAQIYRDARPAFDATLAIPFGKDAALRGTAFARYETADTDDPLASWLKRLQIEATLRPVKPLLLAAGWFAQIKENVLLENEERGRGFYTEATYEGGGGTALVFRLEWSKTFKTVIDEEIEAVDIQVGIRKKL